MRVLGIDYGRKRVGIAIGINGIIETKPFFEGKKDEVLVSLKVLCGEEGVEKVIVGVSEGKMAHESKQFAKTLRSILKLPVELIDETLTTQEARQLRSKRQWVDSVAAAILLERFWLKKGG